MKILIVEDEYPTAEYTEQLCREILGKNLTRINMVHDLAEALAYVKENEIDLCLLDLNLHGEDGYELLQTAVAQSFHTIVISAYPDQAVNAFQYGVLDFIVKPFEEKRLSKALDIYLGKSSRHDIATKYLSVRHHDKYKLVNVDDVRYIKSDGPYTELVLSGGQKELFNKTMNRLENILPSTFIRIHRSYFVNYREIKSFEHIRGGKYQLTLHDDTVLPLSRNKYKQLYDQFNK